MAVPRERRNQKKRDFMERRMGVRRRMVDDAEKLCKSGLKEWTQIRGRAWIEGCRIDQHADNG